MKIITRRVVIIGSIGLLTYFTPQTTCIDIYHRNNPEYAELLKKNFEDPDNKEISNKLYKLQEEMNQ